jgi:solute carrier family 25 (mitochondrial iron transporter), member 28/37
VQEQALGSLEDLHRHNNVKKVMRSIIKNEGVTRLWRGVAVVAAGAIPGHAVYFASYELGKEFFAGANSSQRQAILKSDNNNSNNNSSNNYTNNNNNNNNNNSNNSSESNGNFVQGLQAVLGTSIAGACATFAQDAVMTPSDVVKQRIQVANSPYKSIGEAAMNIFRKEGLSAFYISFPTTLMMNVPYAAVYFTTYEHLFPLMSGESAAEDEEEDGQFHPFAHIIAGGVAGGAAAAVTNPMDVVKTRLQTKELYDISKRQQYNGMISATKLIYKEEGLASFFKGVRARVLFHVPAAAICLTSYASCKFFLFNRKESLRQD